MVTATGVRRPPVDGRGDHGYEVRRYAFARASSTVPTPRPPPPPPILPSLVRSNHNPSPPSERATADVSLLPRSPLESADPSSGDVPIELIEEALQHGKATCVAFNRRGTLLAAGTAAGSVQVWDFQTRSVARELVSDSAEESAAILSVAWSRDGRKLMSSAADGSLTVWDVAEADDVFRHTFDAPLHRAQFNPDNPSLALVCPSDDGPMTFALGRGRKRTPLPQMPGGIDVPSLVCRIPSAGLDTSATRAPAHALYSEIRRARLRRKRSRRRHRRRDRHVGHRAGV